MANKWLQIPVLYLNQLELHLSAHNISSIRLTKTADSALDFFIRIQLSWYENISNSGNLGNNGEELSIKYTSSYPSKCLCIQIAYPI